MTNGAKTNRDCDVPNTVLFGDSHFEKKDILKRWPFLLSGAALILFSRQTDAKPFTALDAGSESTVVHSAEQLVEEAVDMGSQDADAGPEEPLSPVTADRVLVEIRDHLVGLLASKLSENIAVGTLFSVPLDAPKAVASRVISIREELAVLSANVAKKDARLQNLDREIPEVPRPAKLDQRLVAPAPPIEPQQPERPAIPRPRGGKSPKRSAAWLDRFVKWEEYDAKYALFEEAKQNYQEALERYEKKRSEYEHALSEQQEAAKNFERLTRERNRSLARLRSELSREAADSKMRVEIAELRLSYLTTLTEVLEKMPEPALVTFTRLKSERTSIRGRATRLGELEKRIAALIDRSRILSHRASAGALIGFEMQKEQLVQDIQAVIEALQRRKEATARLAAEFLEGASNIESRSAKLRTFLLLHITNPKRTETIDAAFLRHLKEMREGVRGQSFSLEGASDIDFIKRLQQDVERALAAPESIDKFSQAASALRNVKVLVERLDSNIDAEKIELEQFFQASRRESVTVLAALASDKTRGEAYSFSRELLADLIADFQNVKTSLLSWAEKKRTVLSRLPSELGTGKGVILITRLLLAVFMLLALGLLGSRVSKLVAMAIRRLNAMKFFRHRVSILVRWAGLAESVLPTIVFALAGYSVLALLGFDAPETRFVEVVVRWFVLYALGRSFLEGLTKRVSRGRPAFISMTTSNANLLSKTYGRLGFLSAIAAIAHEWADSWLGAGLLSTLVLWFVWLWLIIWGIWALVSWRVPLGHVLLELKSVSRAEKLGRWMMTYRVGAVASVLAFLWLLAYKIGVKLRAMLSKEGLFAYLRARSLRRLARTTRLESTSSPPPRLPTRYVSEFPLYPIYGEEDAVLLPRNKLVSSAAERLERWRSTRQDSSLVVIGEKGIGKTTFLTLLERELGSHAITRHSLSRKLRSEKALVEELGALFGVPEAAHTGAIANKLMSGEEKVVFLDEAHNVFLRTVDGYDAYEALIRLVNFTSDKVFWVLVFNQFSWAFLNESRKRVHYFRRLLKLPSWSRDELRELISMRNKRSGVEIEFDEMLLDETRSVTGNFEVIDGAEGFFRLLWEASLGNPRVATRLWLDALTPIRENRIRVGLFSEASAGEIIKMDRELLFTLAAVCQHENLSVGELRDVINVSADFAGFAMRFLSEYELLEPKHTDPKRLTLAPRYYPQVLKVLRQNHLLFEKE